MTNILEAVEEGLLHWQGDVYIISAHVHRIGKHTPHDAPDDEHVYQYTICMGIPRPNSVEIYRHGSNSFNTYDDAILTMNKYLQNFYAKDKEWT